VFILYWFTLVPLLMLVCHLVNHWPWWHWPFWTVAFTVWVVITCGIIIFWKYMETKRNRGETLKYGSDHRETPYSSVRQMMSENREFVEMKMNNARDEEKSKRNDRNLPPLTIHKRASSVNEDGDAKQVEKDEMVQGSDVADNRKDRPFQDNLKLVTVSSSEDEVKTPMTPREMFFIDLIREAEKTESARSLETHAKEDAQDATNVKSAKEDTKDAKEDAKDENDDRKMSELKSKRESSYFIADVESTAGEKTEVFLQVNSDVREQAELSAEKPVLMLKSNEENSQETSPSNAR